MTDSAPPKAGVEPTSACSEDTMGIKSSLTNRWQRLQGGLVDAFSGSTRPDPVNETWTPDEPSGRWARALIARL